MPAARPSNGKGIIMTASDENIRRWSELFGRDVDHQYVSADLIGRSTALIETIGGHALDRGFTVREPCARLFAKAKQARWSWPHIVVGTEDGHMLSFHLSERSRHGTEAKTRTLEDRRMADDAPIWKAQRSTRFAPTGVMTIRVDSDMAHYRLKTSKDTVNTPVETRVPNLFDALTGEMVRCREVRRRTAEERRRSAAAKHDFRRERMYAALCEDVSRHDRLQRQRSYLDKVECSLAQRTYDDAAEQEGMLRDINAMRACIDEQDPLVAGDLAWMRQPEPSESEVFTYAHRTPHRNGNRPSGFFD